MVVIRVHILITGNVQGVFFRKSAKMEAENLGIGGWVRNREDGTVEVVAQGQKGAVLKFIKWCRKGPPFAEVESVEVEEKKKLENFEDFSIN